MAIVVLVLWLFTAGAGFYLLATSNLGRARLAADAPAATASAAEPATASAGPATASAAGPATASVATAAAPGAQAAPVGSSAPPLSKREMRRAARERFDPPSLTAAKNAPMVPELRSLLEFAHPACAIVGLGFWLGFTLIHDRALGWIGFGLVTATVCLGLTWFTANARAARRAGSPEGEPAPSFSRKMVVVHGSAAAVTFVLAVLAALVVGR
ncbi:MAG TPA: hypothetical protein VGF32_02265 [Streptosporangiaceae bacterium]|jgi:hypothetical protein